MLLAAVLDAEEELLLEAVVLGAELAEELAEVAVEDAEEATDEELAAPPVIWN